MRDLEKLLDLPESPRWIILAVGHLWLEHTHYSIRLSNNRAFIAYIGETPFALAPTLEQAQHAVDLHLDQTYDMGIDPFTESQHD